MATPPRQLSSPSGALKRKRNENNWKTNIAKTARNLGLAYTSKDSGKEKDARRIGDPCNCKNKCFDRVGQTNIDRIFTEFWQLGSYNLQCSYIQTHTEDVEVKRHRIQNIARQRPIHHKFHVIADNIKVYICLDAFSNILGHNKRTVHRMAKKKTSAGTLITDRRGKHGNHSRIPEEKQQLVIDHISSIPTVTSHYTRVTKPDALYIDGDIKILPDLYDLYKDWLNTNHPGQQPVKFHYYRDVKNTYFPKLYIEKPKVDTCKTCDVFKIKLGEARTPEEIRKIDIERNIHQSKAQKGYDIVTSLKSEILFCVIFYFHDIIYFK